MKRYVCLLRGINVSGHNLIKMGPLRESFEALGLTNVTTYLQSGNVLFDCETSKGLVEKIRARVLRDFKCEVPTLVRSVDELRGVVAKNPFLKQRGVDAACLHVTFLDGKPSAAGLAKLAAIDAGKDELVASGSELYLHTPNGYGRTKLSNTTIERVLGLQATTRNWKTVIALSRDELTFHRGATSVVAARCGSRRRGSS